MPNTTPNSRLAVVLAPLVLLAGVAAAALVFDGVRARAVLSGRADGERSPAGGVAEAHAIVACGSRAWAECARLSRMLVQRKPADSGSWLRLAEAEAGGRDGRLGPSGLAALSASYQASPLGYARIIERFRFSLDHWEELSDDLRQQTRRQLRAGWIIGGPPYGRMRAYGADGANPAGRQLVKVWSREVEATPLSYPDITRQGIQLR